jgi:hypothetical protein
MIDSAVGFAGPLCDRNSPMFDPTRIEGRKILARVLTLGLGRDAERHRPVARTQNG